jgi:hypothetical protein
MEQDIRMILLDFIDEIECCIGRENARFAVDHCVHGLSPSRSQEEKMPLPNPSPKGGGAYPAEPLSIGFTYLFAETA